MFNAGSRIPEQYLPSVLETFDERKNPEKPYVKIIEEPAQKAQRFRYKCEGRSAGSIPGASSTQNNKTFPTIQVVGYQGRAMVVVSCVTKDKPHRPHPHNLVGRDGCKRGVCTLEIPKETMMIKFCNLGIQCVKRKDVESALLIREEIRVDPFRTGFSHKDEPASIDLNSVRLCFQVFLEGKKKGKFDVPLLPKVSQPIFDKKGICDLVIVELSDCVSPVDGNNKKLILLCEKIVREDIQIRFFEVKNGEFVWEGFGDFQPSQVHKQTAISFKPPRYHNLEVTEPVKVFVQLKRPSDGATSEPLPFEFIPISKGRKRPRYDSVLSVDQELDQESGTHQWLQGNLKIPVLGEIPPIPSTSSRLPPISSQIFNNFHSTNMEAAAGMDSNSLYSLLDMDSQQQKQFSLNYRELDTLEDGRDVDNLSETFTTYLSLTDNNENNYGNSTDSLIRLANNTIDNICQGTNTFK